MSMLSKSTRVLLNFAIGISLLVGAFYMFGLFMQNAETVFNYATIIFAVVFSLALLVGGYFIGDVVVNWIKRSFTAKEMISGQNLITKTNDAEEANHRQKGGNTSELGDLLNLLSMGVLLIGMFSGVLVFGLGWYWGNDKAEAFSNYCFLFMSLLIVYLGAIYWIDQIRARGREHRE